MKKFFGEFSTFIMRGNVLDMAVGVIVGGAFGKISSSLVNDIIMPMVGMLLGKVNFTDLKIVLQQATVVDGTEVAEISINYGMFIQQIVDFLIISAAVFVMVKTFNKLTSLRKKQEAVEEVKEEEPAKPTPEELLMEIVALLKEGR
jgi:large conductance mechanosensitive channel protein